MNTKFHTNKNDLFRRVFYGRRQGHKLHPKQARLVESFLPSIRITDFAAAPRRAFTQNNFEPENLVMEIGFGGGEHLAAQAEANPNVGFIGCEPFLNGVAKLLNHIQQNDLLNIRILGFLRDVMIAASLGAGPLADIFVVAFRLPNLFRRLFAEGAFNSAFVPVFAKRMEAEGVDAARKLSAEVLSVLLAGLIVFTLLAEWYMPYLVHALHDAGSNFANPVFIFFILALTFSITYTLDNDLFCRLCCNSAKFNRRQFLTKKFTDFRILLNFSGFV